MTLDDVFELGQIVKTHGLKGQMLFILDVDEPSSYTGTKHLLINMAGRLVPFFVAGWAPRRSASGNQEEVILTLEGVNDVDAAQQLVGEKAYLPTSALAPLEEGRYYFHELVGAQVIDDEHGAIGVVESVLEMPQQIILQITHTSGKEILMPLNDQTLHAFDREAKQVKTAMPPGLLEIYLEE